ncbi:MAG: hypothetical protein KF819_33615 [Labilithrix sp.]|nr:hypothetical protein [Labilithrix sp.]
MRLASACTLAIALAAAGCASEVPADDESESAGSAASRFTCKETDEGLFFHGMHAYGRSLRTDGLCVPSLTNGEFSSDVAFVSAPASKVVGGYSAGRIPLLRRLARAGADSPELRAVLLDGSWADGPRFQGRTGPDIVASWLEADERRRFVLVYAPASAGWREYVELTRRPEIASRVDVCKLAAGHFELPDRATSELFLDPDAWVETRCVRP